MEFKNIIFKCCQTYVTYRVDLRGPGGELLLPGRHGGEGHHHQHRTFERVDVEEILKEGDGLDSLTKTLK